MGFEGLIGSSGRRTEQRILRKAYSVQALNLLLALALCAKL